MKTSVLLSALALLVSSALSNAAVIQCGVGERTAFIGEVDDSTVCETGSKNPKADDINVYFGGDWSIVAELEGGDGQTGFIGNSLFSADVTHGSWGNAPVGGTFSIGSDFWNTNDSAVLSMHIGNGGGEPDHFAWGLIT